MFEIHHQYNPALCPLISSDCHSKFVRKSLDGIGLGYDSLVMIKYSIYKPKFDKREYDDVLLYYST